MRIRLLILISAVLFSCSSDKTPGKNELLTFDPFPLEVPEENSLMAKWEKKPVYKSLLIDDMESQRGWRATNITEMSFTQERSKTGKQSLRFSTSLRDEEHYRRNRTKWNTFSGPMGGTSGIELRFDTPQDWSEFNRVSFWVYVHPTSLYTNSLQLTLENRGAVGTATNNHRNHVIQDLKQGQWNQVLFEMHHLERDKISRIAINQILYGHHLMDQGIVTYDIDLLEIQAVDGDQYEGWEVTPGKFSYSHIGYRPDDKKIAMVSSGDDTDFFVVDQKDNVVFTGNVQIEQNKNGKFRILDFSDIREKGIYRIRYGSVETGPFPVDENIWIQPVFKTLNFFYCQRCGYDIPGIQRECHLDLYGFKGDERKIINGGWHDAADHSQGFFRTGMSVFAMLRNLEGLQKRKELDELADRMQSEMEWGLNWLLKTRFGDGYHMSWVTCRIYTDNEIGNIDDCASPAANIPWENFMAAAIFSKAGIMLEESNPQLAAETRKAAIEDWQAAFDSKKKWDAAEYREAAWGATSSLLLHKMTGDTKYIEKAVEFGNLLMQCQEQSFVDGIPITGYFYKSTERNSVIHNFHHSFEESPLIALSMLCHSLPNHEKWIEWYGAVVLHSEFFMKRGSKIAAPYYQLPNSVWKKSEIMEINDAEWVSINEDIKRHMLQQFSEGTPLNDEYVLRTFPISVNPIFHGSTMINMANSWALAEASRLRNDKEGMDLVGKQLEWVLGANPFGQSLMYGAGYDFSPQWTWSRKNVVGSLPVGIDCLSGDMPNWVATNAACYKEIWVEPSNRFLGAANIYNDNHQLKPEKNEDNDLRTETKIREKDDGVIEIDVSFTGTGKHDIDFKVFNGTINSGNVQISLSSEKSDVLALELKVSDQNKPYVVVINIDNNPYLRKEIVGTGIKSLF